MEQEHWLGRKRASVANAHDAATSEARLVHLDLAGRYSIKAASAAEASCQPAAEAESHRGVPDALADYEQLETGARWLASRARDEAERDEHLGWANRYARLRLEAADPRKR
jgi:hypothetical protein